MKADNCFIISGRVHALFTFFVFLLMIFLTGCGSKLQDSLAKPIEGKDLPDAAFVYNIHALDGQGNYTDGDVIKFNTGGNKTSEGGDFVRLSETTIKSQTEGFRGAAEVLKIVAAQDDPSTATVLLVAGYIETLAAMDHSNLPIEEKITFSRSADPQAWADARTAQFLAEAEKEKARDALTFGAINNGIEAGAGALNPVGTATRSAFDILRQSVAGGGEE